MKRLSASYCFLIITGLLLLAGCGARDVVTGDRDAEGWVDDKTIALGLEKDFLKDDLINYLDFSAYSYDGHVYIVGVYAHRVQTERAVEIAKARKGVKRISTYFLPKESEVQCHLGKRLESGTTIRHKILVDESMWGSDITVEVVNCSIVLIGYVENEQQKATAVKIARSVDGVDTVKSFLKVRP